MKLRFTIKLFLAFVCITNGLFSQINKDGTKYWLGTGTDSSYIVLNFNNQYNNTNRIWGYLSNGSSTVEDVLNELSNDPNVALTLTSDLINVITMGYTTGQSNDTALWRLSKSDVDLNTWTDNLLFTDVIGREDVLGLSFDPDDQDVNDYLNPLGDILYQESPDFMDSEILGVNSFYGKGEFETVVVFDFNLEGVDSSIAYGVRFNTGDRLIDALNLIMSQDPKFSFVGDDFISTIGYDSLLKENAPDWSQWWSVYSNDLGDQIGSFTNSGNSTVMESGFYYSYVYGKGPTARKFILIENELEILTQEFDVDQIKYWLGAGSDSSYVVLNFNNQYNNTNRVWGYLSDGAATIDDIITDLSDDPAISLTVDGGIISTASMGYTFGNKTDTSEWKLSCSNLAFTHGLVDLTINDQIGRNEVLIISFDEDINHGDSKDFPVGSYLYQESPDYLDNDINGVKYFVGEGELTTTIVFDFNHEGYDKAIAFGVRFNEGDSLLVALNTIKDNYDLFSFEGDDFISTVSYDTISKSTPLDYSLFWSVYSNDLSDNIGSTTNAGNSTKMESGHYYSYVYGIGATPRRFRRMFSTIAGENGSNAISKDSSIITSWASNVTVSRGFIDISNESAEDQGSVRASYGEEANAIGVASGTSSDVISLGDAGEAILTFETPITNGEGPDFVVFENSFNDSNLELAFVEVSSNGVDYVRFPAISQTQTSQQIGGFSSVDVLDLYNLAGSYRQGFGTPFDLEEFVRIEDLDVTNITHVKLVDVVGSIDPAYGTYDSEGNIINGPFSTPYWSSGFDLDGVGVINENTETALISYASEDAKLVYPNPASDVVTFELTEVANIYSVTGQFMSTVELDAKATYSIVELGLETGVYIVKSGDLTQKLIVK